MYIRVINVQISVLSLSKYYTIVILAINKIWYYAHIAIWGNCNSIPLEKNPLGLTNFKDLMAWVMEHNGKKHNSPFSINKLLHDEILISTFFNKNMEIYFRSVRFIGCITSFYLSGLEPFIRLFLSFGRGLWTWLLVHGNLPFWYFRY